MPQAWSWPRAVSPATVKADPLGMPQRTLPTDATGNPKPRAQRNHRSAKGFAYMDPDRQILKGADGWMQGYNAQAAVDGCHQLIVAIGMSNQASDAVHLLPMLERIEANICQRPRCPDRRCRLLEHCQPDCLV